MRDDTVTRAVRRCGRTVAATAALCLLTATFAAAQTPQRAGHAKPAPKPAEAPTKLILEPRAMALLKAMSDRLAAAKSMSFTATVGYEFPSQLGPPILYTTRYDVTMRRPDRLKILQPGDGPASEFYYDGKSMMAYAPKENLVAIADAPPTIDEALKKAFQTAAIYYPFTDLLVDDPYAAIASTGKLAFYIGPSDVVGGAKTEMLAWADDDVFVQAWIGADDKLPRRVRAVYSADPLRLRHDMELSNWQLDPPVTDETFISAKAAAAPHIEFAHPEASLPPGVKPITMAKPNKPEPAKSTVKP
jgi:hypothetical protein